MTSKLALASAQQAAGVVNEVRNEASAQQTFTIPNGANGSAVTPVDLGAPYKIIVVRCEDAQYIPGATNMSADAGYAAADNMCTLYEENDPSTAWSKGALPTTGDFCFALTHSFGARRLRLILSNNSTGGDTVLYVRGYDQMTQL